MADYVEQIYAQAGFGQSNGYWEIPAMEPAKFTEHLLKNTNLLARISKEENIVESLGFIRRNILEYTRNAIVVIYDSTVNNSDTARITIEDNAIDMTFTDGYCYSTLEGLLWFRPQYWQSYDAEKNAARSLPRLYLSACRCQLPRKSRRRLR